MMTNIKNILDKYGDIIKEEVNVKNIQGFDKKLHITKTYKPNGGKLSAQFGKDTGRIIQYGKKGNVEELDNNNIKIFDDENNERILSADQYDITYAGLEDDTVAVDKGTIIQLDTHITPELAQEGIARELSRTLNQMRKDADYRVDQRVTLYYHTANNELQEVMKKFDDFLQQEALLASIVSNDHPTGDVTDQRTDENDLSITFALQS